jgi:hypothetical protein
MQVLYRNQIDTMTRFKSLRLRVESVLTKAIAYVKTSPPPVRKQDGDDHLSHRGEEQSIPTTDIDPKKSTALLDREFGAGNYKIHVSIALQTFWL